MDLRFLTYVLIDMWMISFCQGRQEVKPQISQISQRVDGNKDCADWDEGGSTEFTDDTEGDRERALTLSPSATVPLPQGERDVGAVVLARGPLTPAFGHPSPTRGEGRKEY